MILRSNKGLYFGAGWTPQIERQIRACNVNEISHNLSKLGIETDFKGNKVIAWCCDKVVSTFSQMNEKYDLKIHLPEGIYVEDFTKLNVSENKSYGICNWLPAYVCKDSDKAFPERTVFFNNQKNWEKVNSIVDDKYKSGEWSSPLFLHPIIHELGHVWQNGYLLKKLGF